MNQLFQNVLTASFHGSIVIAAVILLRLAMKKAPRKFICLLWLLAGLRLLMPFEIKSDLSLQPEAPAVVTQQQAAQTAAPAPVDGMPAEVEPAVRKEAPVFTGPVQEAESHRSEDSAEETPVQTVTVTEEKAPLDWTAAIPYVWLTVACGFGVYSLISYLSLRRKVRFSVKIPGGWECDRIDTAFILGFIKPKIYIPMGMSKTVRRHILAHERTHLEKGDHWFKMIGFLALALHWFNPLVWVAYILLCKDIEMACDERVVQFMELEERKEYSAALLSCSTNRAHFAACPVAFGEVSVKERIKSVLNYRKPSFWISLVGVIAIVFVSVCLVTSPAEGNDPATGDDTISASSTDGVEGETAQRIADGIQAIMDQECCNVGFFAFTDEGGVGWQVNYYALGDNKLWRSTDHINEEGYMHLDGQDYIWIENDSHEYRWAPADEYQDQLDDLLALFDLEGKELVDIKSETRSNENGYTYEDLSFYAQHKSDDGNLISQNVEVTYNREGKLSRIDMYDVEWTAAENMAFFPNNLDEEGVQQVFDQNAQWIDMDLVAVPLTEDELKVKEWGIQFRVEDDILTRYGSEAWFAQSEGYNMTVSTNNEYWLEKKTASGWEKLPMIAEPQWADANYTLGHGMYSMVVVDWSQLYGPLSSGTYRMGKIFNNMTEGGQSCTAYAEFEIFYNDSSSAEQTAAVEKCYAAIEELKNRDHIHYKVTAGTDTIEEVWWNNEDYLAQREWRMAVMPEDDTGDAGVEPVGYETRRTISARLDGVGYQSVHETKDDVASEIIGMELSTLSANRAGWNLYDFAESLYLSFFERGNEVIDFPAEDSCITDEMIRFHQYWSDPNDYTATTFWFDGEGRITKMEYETHYDDLEGYTTTYEIYDTTAAEIDAKIKPYTENLIVDSFSWKEAKAKYTDDKFNIRENNFVNNDATTISGPVDAAKRALMEYPNLGEYLKLDVYHDETAGMWKVTIESYVDYQSTYGYRDIYMDENGVTFLLVYEGPIGYDQSRQ